MQANPSGYLVNKSLIGESLETGMTTLRNMSSAEEMMERKCREKQWI